MMIIGASSRHLVGVWIASLFLLAPIVGDAPAVAQGGASNEALRDRVLQLLERLESPKPEVRDAAQASLIKLGAKALALLPDSSKAGKPELSKRLEEIRAAIGKQEPELDIKASRVTIVGNGIRLSEAIAALQKQTKNPVVDFRDSSASRTSNPSLDLEIRDQTFFQALQTIAEKAQVSLSFTNGDGSIGILEGAMNTSRASQESGPFLVILRRIGLFRDFETDLASANVQVEVAWEPRLRPMMLALKADELEIVDDRGKPVPPQVDRESTEVVLRPENPIAEVDLSLMAPERAAKSLAKFALKAEVTVPSDMKLFRFTDLTKERASQQIGDVQVVFKGAEVEDNIWRFNIELVYPGEGPAFESYRQGLFNNRIWLQKPDGARFDHNGGFSNTVASGGKLGFEYLFVDVPGKLENYELVYETPSKVVTIPLEVTFKDVKLP